MHVEQIETNRAVVMLNDDGGDSPVILAVRAIGATRDSWHLALATIDRADTLLAAARAVVEARKLGEYRLTLALSRAIETLAAECREVEETVVEIAAADCP